jgi:hypothetical protein
VLFTLLLVSTVLTSILDQCHDQVVFAVVPPWVSAILCPVPALQFQLLSAARGGAIWRGTLGGGWGAYGFGAYANTTFLTRLPSTLGPLLPGPCLVCQVISQGTTWSG